MSDAATKDQAGPSASDGAGSYEAGSKEAGSRETDSNGTKPGLAGLTREARSRYSRHLLLPEVGPEGQRRLMDAKVLIVGAGGLGSPVALYLAAAGVGTVGLIDPDLVEASDLQRQIIHKTSGVGRAKVDSAGEAVKDLNPLVEVRTHRLRLDSSNAMGIVAGYDVVADCSDNYPARYLVGDVCRLSGKPDVYASVHQFEGQAAVFAPGGPCYRCLYPTPPEPGLLPSCGEAGVMGVLPGILGTVQAAEVVKIILGAPRTLAGRLLTVDAWLMTFLEIELERDPGCPLCGDRPTVDRPADYELFCRQEAASPGETMTPEELLRRLDSGERPQIVDLRDPHERLLMPVPGSMGVSFAKLRAAMPELDPGRDLVLICGLGSRSLFAARLLKKAGHPGRVLSLAGGARALAAARGDAESPY